MVVTYFIYNPKRLFLIDGFGALLSAFLLGVLLVRYESVFGIPQSTLYVLAIIPCFFALYDLLVYFLAKQVGTFLKIIAVANIFYCTISIGTAIYHSRVITLYGWIYLILEVLVVFALANIEWKVSLDA